MLKNTLTILVVMIAPALAQKNPRPHLDSSSGIGNTIVSHIADGGGWKTSIVLVNLSQSKAANFRLNLFGDDGTPQQFTFESLGSKTVVSGTLAVGGSVVIKTAGTSSPITQGWGQLDSLATTDSVGGYAVFRNGNGNEAAVPFESTIGEAPVLPLDNTNGLGMGVALANSDFTAMTINATFRDGNGGVIGTSQFTMQPNTHTSFVLTDKWPFTAGKQGTVSFDCSDKFGKNAFGLAVLGLRFTPAGAFTSVAAFTKWTLD